VYQILKNPVVKLDPDTVNIKPVNVSASQRTDYDKAMKNIQGMGFDFRPLPDDAYTESERMKDLLNTENRVQKSAASALTYQISPSEIFGKLAEKRKKKKEAKQFSSTRKSELQE
jgi:monomeric isocitrate dehydrogenase